MEQNQQIEAITKALAYTENNGAPDISNLNAGKTGELKSIFQFEPDTWKNYSEQAFGKIVPMTPDAETSVVLKKVSNWYDQDIKEGYSPEESAKRIASRWNAGAGEPDAYTGKFSDGSPSTGINKKYGIKYSVPEYADKFDKYFKEFSSGENSKITSTKKVQSNNNSNENSNAIGKLTDIMTQAKLNQTSISNKNKGMLNQGNNLQKRGQILPLS